MPHSAEMAKNREFEDWEIGDAARLKSLIDIYLDNHKITQSEFTARCGWSQGMIYQYTKPERALGLDTVAKFANALSVKIDEISPVLAEQIRELSQLTGNGIRYSPKSKEAEMAARIVDSMESTKQRDKAVKIVATIAEPEGNGGDSGRQNTGT